jgi:hypothetical protein
MTTLFLIICGISVVFFAVFLLECSRPHRKGTTARATGKSVEAEVIEPPTRRRSLAHVEQQMSDSLAHHGRTAA